MPIEPPPPADPDPDEYEYLENVLIILEATEISFEVFLILLEFPTFDTTWYHEFDQVTELWQLFHPALSTLDPPAEYQEFHDKLLDAYWVLGLAADDFIVGFYTFDEHYLEQGLIKLEQFIELFEEAVELFPHQSEDPVFFELDNGFPALDDLDGIHNHGVWDDLIDRD